MEFGFVRETEKQALNEDTETRIIKTGLDAYLKYIFPQTSDWVHDKAFPNMRIRPDYRSDTLKLIVEFDGLPHFTSREVYLKDIEKTKNMKVRGLKLCLAKDQAYSLAL